MIAHLNGIIDCILDDSLVLDVAGIGYEVWMPHSALHLQPQGSVLKVLTYHHIREEQQTLYGFLTSDDRRLFELLIGVSGVGPKVALKLMSALSQQHIIQAILGENLSTLTQVSGVGKKMAERLVVELKDKLHKLGPSQFSQGSASSGASLQHTDIVLALKALGYSQEEIKQAFSKAPALPDDITVENGIKHLLRYLL